MKKTTASLFAIAVFAAGVANAQIAFDTASNYTTATWTNGANAGSGVQPWSLNVASGATNFIGNPADAGIGTTGIGTTAFGMRATQSGNYADAVLTLNNPLALGQILSFYWAVNWDTDGGGNNKGFNLLAGTNQVVNVNIGGSSTITVNGVNANTNYGTDPMLVSIGRSALQGYYFSLTSRSGGSAYQLPIFNSNAVDSVAFYAANNNDDVNRNMYFNNIQVVPEPSTYALLSLGALALGGYAVRRRARK
jgi:hypothetical protein